jgi:hypothetical protein
MSPLAAALLLQATPEAIQLGEELASYGTLATLAPIMTAKEAEDLVAAHPELTKADQDNLRATAKNQAEKLRARGIKVEGRVFAENLSLEDLRALTQFARSDAAKRQRAAMPKIIVGTMKGLGNIDYKASVIAAYCRDYRKLCPKKK